MQKKLTTTGNSRSIVLNKKLLEEAKIGSNTKTVDVRAQDGVIIIKKLVVEKKGWREKVNRRAVFGKYDTKEKAVAIGKLISKAKKVTGLLLKGVEVVVEDDNGNIVGRLVPEVRKVRTGRDAIAFFQARQARRSAEDTEAMNSLAETVADDLKDQESVSLESPWQD